MPTLSYSFLGIVLLLLVITACGRPVNEKTGAVDKAASSTTASNCDITTDWDNVHRGMQFIGGEAAYYYRVFQRTSIAEGFIPAAITTSVSFDCVQVSVVDSTGRVISNWASIGTRLSSRYDGNITVPAGGWYKLRARGILAGVVSDQIEVTHVGVGEVFIVAGQSNSTFCGQTAQKSTSGFVSYYSKGKFIECDDAKFDKSQTDTINRGAPWCLLGDKLYEALKVPIAFDPVGYGGTVVAQWQPLAQSSPLGKGALYTRLHEHRRFFGPNGIRAILWHQGESDAALGTTNSVYKSRMKSLMTSLEKDSGMPSNWGVAEVGYLSTATAAQRAAIVAAQRSLVNGTTVFTGAKTDALIGAAYRFDGTHFNAAGLAAHAHSWLEKLVETFFD